MRGLIWELLFLDSPKSSPVLGEINYVAFDTLSETLMESCIFVLKERKEKEEMRTSINSRKRLV